MFLFILIILLIIILFLCIINKNKLTSDYTKHKIGVIITTHGNNGRLLTKCLDNFIYYLPKNSYIVLYVNESTDPITLSIKNKYPTIEYIFINDQITNGGLTGTWNQGIDKCIENNCKIIIISNDDLYINYTIRNMIKLCIDNYNLPYYYGPISNNFKSKKLNIYQQIKYYDNNSFIIHNNLHGFFMMFPIHVLIKNKYDKYHYFNPKYQFEGNEVEWYKRFKKKKR